MGVGAIFKMIGVQALKTVSSGVTRQIIAPATSTIVDRLREYLCDFCRECYDTPNPGDDFLADFLVEIFDLDLEKKWEK